MGFPVEAQAAPETVGMDARRLEAAINAFKRQHGSGGFPGGQLVVRRWGKLVVNEAVGVAKGFRADAMAPVLKVTPRTLFPVYSAGKPLAGIAIAILEDRGLLDVNAPIAELFPEFAKNGKGQITTLDVLTHRSGILLPHLAGKPEIWQDREAMSRQLADAVPVYKRGTLAYQPGEFGWLLSEVVSRVDGRPLADFIEQEIIAPLRLAGLQYGLKNNDYNAIAYSYWLGKSKLMLAGLNVAANYERLCNDPVFLGSRDASFTLIANATSLAAFYEFLLAGGIMPGGGRLASEKTLRAYTTRHVVGWDKSVKAILSVGRGFMTGGLTPSLYGWWNTQQCFGHPGVFSCLAFGDYKTEVAVAMITNGNRGPGDLFRRFAPISHACRAAARL